MPQDWHIYPHPKEIVEFFTRGELVALDRLPTAPGLYALADHTGTIRYIGMTMMGIRRRVWNYHCAGDRNSHKYSSAYNAGCFWHERKHPGSCPEDGKIAKRLRAAFTRKYCKAAGLGLEGIDEDRLREIERQVIDLYPVPLPWNDKKRIDPIIMDQELDRLASEIPISSFETQALRRQSQRYQTQNQDQV